MGRLRDFWVKNERNVIIVISFTCVFLLGYFTGRIDSLNHDQPTITIEKSTNNTNLFKEGIQPQTEAIADSNAVLGTVNEPGDCAVGQIKGNISSSSRIYHLPGGSFYNRTDAEVCFNSESEAQAAGFRKSQR